jgi:predicted nuclease with TOPRIM domain
MLEEKEARLAALEKDKDKKEAEAAATAARLSALEKDNTETKEKVDQLKDNQGNFVTREEFAQGSI